MKAYSKHAFMFKNMLSCSNQAQAEHDLNMNSIFWNMTQLTQLDECMTLHVYLHMHCCMFSDGHALTHGAYALLL